MPEPPEMASPLVVPNVCGVVGVKIIAACGVLATAKLCVTLAAASQLLLPTWLATISTVPSDE